MMYLQLTENKTPSIETFSGKSAEKRKFKSYFLYRSRPTKWKENWRNISGFHISLFGRYFTFCVWR